ncbi:copper homeostasis protein CutC [Agromyces sp. NPDC058484]|uniref:copper homeostasis protein CutC n=1 Tax=Agromyces sp. NPDC058484 TaxID=3346524 RepID=UPI00364D6D8A
MTAGAPGRAFDSQALRPRAVEIAVHDPAGARIAFEAGADRVELCTAPGTGGLTPSIGTVAACVRIAEAAGRLAGVHVLVRPREGGYVYTAEEVETQLADIRAVVEAGAGGVVIGALTADGQIDRPAVERLVLAAGEAAVTFHRALDAMPDPQASVDVLVGLGISRILTSGGAARSIDGATELAALADRADGRLEVMAGGGVRPVDIPTLFALGIDAVHLSARQIVEDPAPTGPVGGASLVSRTDPALVHAAVAAARR